jgi:hypothetical protein
LTRADDQLLAAPHHLQRTIRALARHVAGVEPARGIQHLGRGGGVAVVAAHASRAAHPELAHLPGRHRQAAGAAQAGLHARNRLAHGTVGTRRTARLGDGGAGFGQSIAVVQRLAQRLLDLGLEAGRQRRTGHADQAQCRCSQRLLLRARLHSSSRANSAGTPTNRVTPCSQRPGSGLGREAGFQQQAGAGAQAAQKLGRQPTTWAMGSTP